MFLTLFFVEVRPSKRVRIEDGGISPLVARTMYRSTYLLFRSILQCLIHGQTPTVRIPSLCKENWNPKVWKLLLGQSSIYIYIYIYISKFVSVCVQNLPTLIHVAKVYLQYGMLPFLGTHCTYTYIHMTCIYIYIYIYIYYNTW